MDEQKFASCSFLLFQELVKRSDEVLASSNNLPLRSMTPPPVLSETETLSTIDDVDARIENILTEEVPDDHILGGISYGDARQVSSATRSIASFYKLTFIR
jgi:hypothetical protein